MLLATAGLWLPLYLQRRAAHQPNVDDYLYTIQSLNLAHAGSVTSLAHAVLHTGQHAPLVPLLAALGAVHGVDGAVAVELPLLLLLASGAWLLARRWVGPRKAALIGLATAANQAVLGWSLMLHFSVAASALCLWSLAAYLWSEGFRRWGWSLVTGLSVGLLLLSRTLAPVYAAAIVLVICIDMVWRRRLPWAQMGLAAMIALTVAGPWWLVSGGTALEYLRTAGYQASSGFAQSGPHLSPSSISDRIRWTLADLGTVQSIILLAAPITAVMARRPMPGASVVAGWLVVTLIGLATSSNIGTGFGLPIVAVAITVTGALILVRKPKSASSETGSVSPDGGEVAAEAGAKSRPGAPPRRRRALLFVALIATLLILALLVRAISSNAAGTSFGSVPLVAITVLLAGAVMAFRPAAAVLILAVLGFGFAAEWSGGASRSWLGPPYRVMALRAANGAPAPNIDFVHREIAQAIGGRRTLLVRDDDLLNANGLAYTAILEHLPQQLISAPFGDAAGGAQKLKDAQLLIVGTSPAPYHHYASVIEATAARNGWTKTRVWRLACGNTVDLWQKKAVSPQSGRRRSHEGSPYRALVLADSPAAFWRLDDKSCEAVDASGNANTGTHVGKPKLEAQPLIAGRDTSLRFDGSDDEITFLDSPSLGSTTAISIEAWVRPDDVPSASGSAWQLVSKWNTALLFLAGGPTPKFVFALYDNAASAYTWRVASTTTVKPHTVYQVVGTYDGSKMRIYVNGSLESRVTHSGSVNDSSYGGVISAKGWGTLPSPHFRGNLAEIAVYARPLPSTRISAHYRTGTKHVRRGPKDPQRED